MSPKILPAAHGSSAPAPSRSAPSLLPAWFSKAKMKGKTSAHIPGKLQTPGKPGDGSVRCSLCQEGGLFGGESGIFKEKFCFQPCDPQGEETSQTAPKSRKSGLFPLRGSATRAGISLISSQSWSRRRELWKFLGYGAFWGARGVSQGFGNATRRRHMLGQL